MDYKAELIKLQHHCLVNRNYLMNSEGDIDKGARSVYQEIRVKIMEIFERAEAESNHTSKEQLATPAVSNSGFKCADPELQPIECEKWRGCFDCPYYRQS